MRRTFLVVVALMLVSSCDYFNRKKREQTNPQSSGESSSLSLRGLLTAQIDSTGTFAKPCADRPGQARPHEGELCTGNLLVEAAFDQIPDGLVYNSQDPETVNFGFGQRWRLASTRFIKVISPSELALTEGDGTTTRWLKDSRGYFLEESRTLTGRIEFTSAAPDTAIEILSEEVRITYEKGNNTDLRVKSMADRNGNQTLYTWQAPDRVSRIVFPYGFQVDYTYDATASAQKVEYSRAGAAIATNTITLSNSQLTEIATPDGRRFTFGYVDSRMTTGKYPNGSWFSVQYIGGSSVYEMKDSSGYTQVFEYSADKVGRASESGSTIESYEIRGAKAFFIENKIGNMSTRFSWDTNERLVSTTDVTQVETRFTYSGTAKLPAQIQSHSTTTTYTYDAERFDLITKVAASQGSQTITTENSYNSSGDIVGSNVNGRVFVYERDGRGNLTRILEAGKEVEKFTYNADGSIATTTDRFGRETTYRYTNGALTELIDFLGRTTRRTYDLRGNVTSEVSPDGMQNSYGYDSGNRLTSSSRARNGVSVATTYGYALKSNGNVASQTMSSLINAQEISRLTEEYGGEHLWPTKKTFSRNGRSIAIWDVAQNGGTYSELVHSEPIVPEGY